MFDKISHQRNYTIDIIAWDIFLNEIEQNDAVNLLVVESLPSTPGTGLDTMLIAVPGAMIGTALVAVLVVFLRRR